MSVAAPERRFVVASSYSQADAWLDQLLAIRPLRTEDIETRLGAREATIAQVVEIGPSGAVTDHGESPIWWSVVRGQLRAATAEQPWVAGRFVKVGNAFRLDSLTDTEELVVTTALAVVEQS